MANNPTEYFICRGDALITLQAYSDEIDLLKKNHKNIIERFNKEAQASQESHAVILGELWKRMALLIGLDPEKTWQNPDYSVDTRYLKDGFGAILFDPVDKGAFAKIMGAEPPEKALEPAMSEVPDKEKLH